MPSPPAGGYCDLSNREKQIPWCEMYAAEGMRSEKTTPTPASGLTSEKVMNSGASHVFFINITGVFWSLS